MLCKERAVPTVRDAGERHKQDRGRREKSECTVVHYQKTKIQGVSRDHAYFS